MIAPRCEGTDQGGLRTEVRPLADRGEQESQRQTCSRQEDGQYDQEYTHHLHLDVGGDGEPVGQEGSTLRDELRGAALGLSVRYGLGMGAWLAAGRTGVLRGRPPVVGVT